MSTEIEKEIVAKGLTAPRVTPADLEKTIDGEYFYNGHSFDGLHGRKSDRHLGDLSCLTICVLVTKNGFTVVGKSACVSPENFDAELGRKIARQDAVNQLWPLLGYALKERLANGG